MRRSLFLLLVVACVSFLPGCAGHPGGAAPEVVITNVFPNNAVQVGGPPITLQAQVIHDRREKGVQWRLTAANVDCSPACGTLVPTGDVNLEAIYTPPKTAPLNQQAAISAISIADPTSNYTFIFTIIPPTSVTITNKFASVIAGSAAVTVNATVANDSTNSGVNWTLTANGMNCAPDCGTLLASAAPSFAASYVPPSSVPAGADANPTITATSVASAAASDDFSFQIQSASSLLSGSYVFLLRGYDSFSGQPMDMAGAISADGKGNITAGEIDFDNDGGLNYVASATGTYTIDPSFDGITRGTIEITSFTFPNSNIDLRYRFVLSADGHRGHMIELDGSGYLNSGTIQLQNSMETSSAPTGNFAFGLDSDAPLAGRIVSAGQLVLGAQGVTGGVIDQSKAADPSPTYTDQAITPDTMTAPDSNGRGTLNITVGGNTTHYAYYLVDSDHIRLIQIDQGLLYGTVQAGTAVKQSNLTASSSQATSVVQFTGMDEPSGTDTPGPDVVIGVMTISDTSAFDLTFDSNDLGAVFNAHTGSGAITSFDPTTGRAVLSWPGGFESGFVDSAVLYYYDQGSAFIIDTDISTPDGTPPDQAITNNAFSGTLTPQTATSVNASTVSGNVIAGFGGSASSNVPNWDLAFNFDSSAGKYTALGDLTSLTSQDGEAIDGQFSGSYQLLNSTTGHFAFSSIPAAVFGDFTSGANVPASFYVIAPNQFVMIGQQAGTYSGIAFFDPQ